MPVFRVFGVVESHLTACKTMNKQENAGEMGAASPDYADYVLGG
jgi:hypothetical protein